MAKPRPVACVVLLGLSALASSPIRGVAPEDQAKFQAAGSTFACASRGSTVALPHSAVNDNYCDCDDGSDEPGTGACAGQVQTLFYCANTGSTPKRIYASRVNDGICDCCDGTDELLHGGRCRDNCVEQGAREREERERRTEEIKAGLAKKQVAIEQAVKDRDAALVEVEALKTQLSALEEAEAAKKAVVDAREAMEKAEREAAVAAARDKAQSLCFFRHTAGCDPVGSREPDGDKKCEEEIPAGSSGFCDCDGDGLKSDAEGGFDCSDAPETCQESCGVAVQQRVSWTDLEGDKSSVTLDDRGLMWEVPDQDTLEITKLTITQDRDDPGKEGVYTIDGPFGASIVTDPPAGPEQKALVLQILSMAKALKVPVGGQAAKRLKIEKRLAREEAQASAQPSETAEGAPPTEEKKQVSEYAKWMEDAESELKKADAPTDAEKPQVSEYTKWMDGAEEATAGASATQDETAPETTTTTTTTSSLSEEDKAKEAEDAVKKQEKDEYETATTAVRENKDQASKLEKRLEVLADENLGYASLIDQTLEKRIGEFTYKINFFDKASQDHTSLGTWSKWTGRKSGEFTGGQSCWQGPERKLDVRFECGLEADILDVAEPSKCVYAAVITHPGACVESDLAALVSPPVMHPHDEL